MAPRKSPVSNNKTGTMWAWSMSGLRAFDLFLSLSWNCLLHKKSERVYLISANLFHQTLHVTGTGVWGVCETKGLWLNYVRAGSRLPGLEHLRTFVFRFSRLGKRKLAWLCVMTKWKNWRPIFWYHWFPIFCPWAIFSCILWIVFVNCNPPSLTKAKNSKTASHLVMTYDHAKFISHP